MIRCQLRHLAVIVFSLLSTLIFASSTHAQTGDDGKWQFQLAPYAWLAGQKGTVATIPGLPPTDIDINFYDDILGNIKGALFLVAEARKDRIGIVMDAAYVDIEDEATALPPYFPTIESRTTSWIVSAAGFYRLVQDKHAFLDALAGVRYWSVDSKLTLTTGILPGREVSNKETWFDPIIGLKGFQPLGASKFFISGFVAIGGFGLGSDFMWDANANLGYQWTQGFATTIGYRYLDVDYSDDDFLYDVAQDGIVLGLSWQF